MALTKYIYKDIQPEITETFPGFHIDDEKLISLFKGWGFDIIINGSISWNLTLVQDNGYAIGFKAPQAIKIRKPHKYVDQIIFKNIDKSIKQEQNTIDGDYILVTNATIYLSEISYRMDATNAYLWSTYNDLDEKTHAEVNLLKDLRFNIDTQYEVNDTNRAKEIYNNPSLTQQYQYSRNSKYGFNGYLGNFINLKTNIIEPSNKIKGQHNYSQNKNHPIEKGQFWGTESNDRVIEVLYNGFNDLYSHVPTISYNEDDDSYTINRQTFYFPHDVTFYLLKRTPGIVKMLNGFLKDTSDNRNSYLGFNDINQTRPSEAYAWNSVPSATIGLYGSGADSRLQNAILKIDEQQLECKTFQYTQTDQDSSSWLSLPEWLQDELLLVKDIDRYNVFGGKSINSSPAVLQADLRTQFGGISFDGPSFVWGASWNTIFQIEIDYTISTFKFLSEPPKDFSLWNECERTLNMTFLLDFYAQHPSSVERVHVTNLDYRMALRSLAGILPRGKYFDLCGYNLNAIDNREGQVTIMRGEEGYTNSRYYPFSINLESSASQSSITPNMTSEQFGIYEYFTNQGMKTFNNLTHTLSMTLYTSYTYNEGYVLIAVREPISTRLE